MAGPCWFSKKKSFFFSCYHSSRWFTGIPECLSQTNIYQELSICLSVSDTHVEKQKKKKEEEIPESKRASWKPGRIIGRYV